MEMNILAVGDVVGNAGLSFLEKNLRRIQRQLAIDFTVVNGENAAMNGLFPNQAEAILNAGADVITLGNHTFGKEALTHYLDDCPYILRPANLAPQCPGRGYAVYETARGSVCVISLIGRCGMNFGPDNPFLEVDRILKRTETPLVILDFHAEATSEKGAMGWYLDGRISALWGTHTHVQTADAQVLPHGTGFVTDLGMTGPRDSVLGIDPRQSISLFLGNPPQRYAEAPGPCKLECARFTVDPASGRCRSAEAFCF